MFRLFRKNPKRKRESDEVSESLYSDETEIDTDINSDIMADYIDEPEKLDFRIKTFIISMESSGLEEEAAGEDLEEQSEAEGE